MAAFKIQFFRVLPALASHFLLKIERFYCFRLPKRHSNFQKRTHELKMSENEFRLEASDWEKSCFENGSCLPAEF